MMLIILVLIIRYLFITSLIISHYCTAGRRDSFRANEPTVVRPYMSYGLSLNEVITGMVPPPFFPFSLEI